MREVLDEFERFILDGGHDEPSAHWIVGVLAGVMDRGDEVEFFREVSRISVMVAKIWECRLPDLLHNLVILGGGVYAEEYVGILAAQNL